MTNKHDEMKTLMEMMDNSPSRKITETVLSEERYGEDAEEMTRLKEEIKDLVEQLYDVIPNGDAKNRAKAYWYPHIMMALDNDHMWMGGGNTTVQDTIEELSDEFDMSDYEGQDPEPSRPSPGRSGPRGNY